MAEATCPLQRSPLVQMPALISNGRQPAEQPLPWLNLEGKEVLLYALPCTSDSFSPCLFPCHCLPSPFLPGEGVPHPMAVTWTCSIVHSAALMPLHIALSCPLLSSLLHSPPLHPTGPMVARFPAIPIPAGSGQAHGKIQLPSRWLLPTTGQPSLQQHTRGCCTPRSGGGLRKGDQGHRLR